MEIAPLRNLLLVLPLKEEKTPSGLVLSGTASRGEAVKGVVIAAGPGIYQNGTLIKSACSAGDTVLYPNQAGTEISVDNVKHIMISEDIILARVSG